MLLSRKQVNNLEERVKIDVIKEALTRVFQYYGPILDVIAKSSLKRKGQAFIVFDSEKSALEAVEEMNGFEMYGKSMKVARAKTHSDETVKRKAADMFEEHKRKRLMLKGMSTTECRCTRADEDQTSSAQKKTQKRKPIPQHPRRNLALPKPVRPLYQTSTCDPTRRYSCRIFQEMWTRTISRRFSSASKDSRKCVWFRSDLWLSPSSRTSSLRLRPRKQRQIHQLVQRVNR